MKKLSETILSMKVIYINHFFLFSFFFSCQKIIIDELDLMVIKTADEEDALNYVSDKCKGRNMPMVLVGAEYQFDRHKLTFYFEADRRIDFRELVRELFSTYKTRIWLQQLSQVNRGMPLENKKN